MGVGHSIYPRIGQTYGFSGHQKKVLQKPTCKAVKTEYSACLGSSVTLRCEVENVSSGEWVCPDTSTLDGTITDTHCLLEIKCVAENSVGEYIYTAQSCNSELIKLNILKPRNIEVIQTFDITLEYETQEQGKEYKWTYRRQDLSKRKDTEGKYIVDGCKLTITNYGKEDEGTYICRDKETEEQLDAFCLKTKYVEVKVDLTFMDRPADEDFRKKLISSTKKILIKDQKLINKESFTISETSKIKTEAELSSCCEMNAVAYIIKERNSTEYEEMRQRYDPATTVFMLFLPGDRRLPDLDFDRKYIAMKFEQNENDVKCKFYENHYKAKWENLLQQLI